MTVVASRQASRGTHYLGLERGRDRRFGRRFAGVAKRDRECVCRLGNGASPGGCPSGEPGRLPKQRPANQPRQRARWRKVPATKSGVAHPGDRRSGAGVGNDRGAGVERGGSGPSRGRGRRYRRASRRLTGLAKRDRECLCRLGHGPSPSRCRLRNRRSDRGCHGRKSRRGSGLDGERCQPPNLG